jgi:glycerol-3-phosphate dehydrogenase (NAD(P)+)
LLVMQEKISRVLILGHGEMGQAMEFLLAPHQPLRIWQRRPAAGDTPVNLEEAVPVSDFILFCLPATAHADVAARIAPLLRGTTLCLSIAKGLDERGRLPAAVLTEALGTARVAVLYGPMISEEIRAGRPAFAELGAEREATQQRVLSLFAGAALGLQPTTDIAGISWSAILKNVYAMLFGVADEMGLGDNLRGYLAATALQELSAIVAGLGGRPATPYGLAGLGDLITTATSRGSHHHELGRRLARGETDALQGEGIHALQSVRQHTLFEWRRYPLWALIERLVSEPAATRPAVQEFLSRLYPP